MSPATPENDARWPEPPGPRSESHDPADADAARDDTAADDSALVLRLWGDTTPPEPGRAAWAETLHRIHAALPPAAPVPARTAPPRRRLGRGWIMTAAGLVAAAALVVSAVGVFLGRHGLAGPDGPDQTRSSVTPGDAPLEVATAEDVEIISIDGRDQDVLVVGRGPLPEPLVLASPDDFRLDAVEPNGDGRIVVLPVVADVQTPMILAPMTLAQSVQ